MVYEILERIVLLSSLGLALDAVFVGKNERDRIRDYFKNKIGQNKCYTERYFRFVNLVYLIVFGRFFYSKIFSFNFFAKATVVSLFSFFVVFLLQIIQYSLIKDILNITGIQFLVLLSFLTFNVIFDYITIVQTKVFIETSISVNSIGRSALLIGSDIIVTLNTFIIAYSAFCVIFIQAFLWESKDVYFVRGSNNESILKDEESAIKKYNQFGINKASSELMYSSRFSGKLMSNLNEENNFNIVIYYYSTIDPEVRDLQPLVLSLSSKLLPLSNLEFTPIKKDDAGGHANEEYIKFRINPFIYDRNSLKTAYTNIFNITDGMEDGFPESIIERPDVVKLHEFLASSAGLEIPSADVAICVNDSVNRILIIEKNLDAINKCKDLIIVEYTWHYLLSASYILSGMNYGNVFIPYNTLLATSLIPTVMVYLVIILLAIMSLIFDKVVVFSKMFEVFFFRSPFCFFGFLVSMSLLTLDFMIFFFSYFL